MDNPDFNKKTFSKWYSQQYGPSEKEGERLFDRISEQITRAILDGGTARVFGLGGFKMVRSRGQEDTLWIRYHPHPTLKKILEERSAALPATSENSGAEDPDQ